MTSINTNLSLNPFKPSGKAKPNETELGLFYTNDMHGDVNRLSKFKTAHDKFLSANSNTPSLTLAAGDCLFGSDKQRNSLMVKLFNLMGLDALALGNHEFAGGTKNLSKSIDKAEFKTVSANIEVEEKNPLQKNIKDKKLVKSAVFMKGGHKFAVIGASPFDSYIQTTDKTVKVKNLENTIKEINDEAKNLEKQGVNKIILLSHLGYGEQGDLAVARQTEGIDVIVGGHTHTKIDGINSETDKKQDAHKLNLLTSKRNEPVLVTQADGMNKYAGYLNAVFDENGILQVDKTENKLVDLNQFEDSKDATILMNRILGKKVAVADVRGSYSPKGSYQERQEENPLANAYADAILERGKSLGVEVSLYHAATIRGGANGQITNYDVKYSMLPFNNEIQVVEISEKDLVQLLKSTSGSLLTSDKDAQLLRCAGMEYSVRNDKEYFLNGGNNPISNIKIGNRTIDEKNPDVTKTVKVALNSYLFDMPCAKDIMAKYKENAVSIGNEQEIFTSYLQDKKEVDCTKQEQRIKLATTYNSWTDLEEARTEVMSKLG